MTADEALAPPLSEPAYVARTAGRLWPGRAVSLRTGPALTRGSGVRELVVLPHLGRPRLLVPTDRVVAAAALSGFKTSASAASRRRMRAAARAVRGGALRLAPSAVRLAPDGDPAPGVEEFLSDVLGTTVSVSVHIGPPRAVRKPVLQLITPTGSTLGFAKVGNSPITEDLVAREASRLVAIDRTRLHRVEVPDVLHSGSWNGMALLAQKALVPTDPTAVSDELLQEAMLEVAGIGGVEVTRLADHRFLERLRHRCSQLPDSPSHMVLVEASRRLTDLAGHVELRFGASHGDWTPWNMVGNGDGVMVWDWEHFQTGVPLGFDAIHHRIHAAVRQGRTPREAFGQVLADHATVLGAFQSGPRAQVVAFGAYVLDIASRYVRDGEVEAGSAVGNVATWCEPALSAMFRSLEREGS